MNGFEKRRERKKVQIMDALISLVMTRSFKDIGIRELAAHAGVSPASIYNYFGSKDELARQVFYRYVERAGDDFIKKSGEDISFKEKVKFIIGISDSKQETISDDGLKNFLFQDPSFQKIIEEYMEKIIDVLVQIIEQGKAEGEITAAVSADAIRIYTKGITHTLFQIGDSLSVRLRKEISHLFLFGLFGREGN